VEKSKKAQQTSKQTMELFEEKNLKVQMQTLHIKKTLTKLYGLMEHIVAKYGHGSIAPSDYDRHNKGLEELLKAMNDPRDGLKAKMAALMQKMSLEPERPFGARDEHGHHESDGRMSKEEMEDILRILQKQKEGIAVLVDGVKKNERVLMTMERELDLLATQY